MEVHHHAHTSRKKWTHYFWEFLMLFLAVFCGFLAEYRLEHKIEKDRELQFIKSMISDLQEDEAMIKTNIANYQSRISLMDSFLTYLINDSLVKSKGDDIYYMARVGPRIKPFVPNNKTFEQLKNSGSFRLIRKNETANRIMEYYNKFPLILTLESIYFEEFSDYKSIAIKLFDPIVFRNMEMPDGNIMRNANNPQLRPHNPELLKDFGVCIVYLNGTNRSLVPAQEDLLNAGSKLITFLREKYRLKD